MRQIKAGLLFVIILLLVSLLVGCGKTLKLNSKWRDCEITIDGVDTEWKGNTIYVEKEEVALSLLNDESHMYLRLVSRNRDVIRQVMMSGLTIWFDPRGGKNKTFGIRYPLGPEKMAMPMTERGHMGDPTKMKERFEKTKNEMEILCQRDEKHRMTLAGAGTLGIKAKVGFSQGMIVYELKVPLNKDVDHPYAVGINTTALITGKSVESIDIGFETPKFDREKMTSGMEEDRPSRMEGGGPPGMEGGGPPGMEGGGPPGREGGGPPGREGNRPPGGYREEPKQLQLWTSVKLGVQPSSEE